MSTLLVRNAEMLVTMDDERREIPGGGLFARDGLIERVGPSNELPNDADQVLDVSGQIVLPGMVNTHHHLDQTLTRNLPQAQNINLFPWLKAHYEIWAQRTPEASELSTLVGWTSWLLRDAQPCSIMHTSSRTAAASTTRSTRLGTSESVFTFPGLDVARGTQGRAAARQLRGG